MFFGNTHSFAIQAIVEPDLVAPSAVWGRMSVFCAGLELGDFSERYCGLFSAFHEFNALSRQLETLWHPSFEGKSDEEILDLLDRAIWGYPGDARTSGQIQDDAAVFARFMFLTDWGEQFDGVRRNFIVSNSGTTRVLGRSIGPGTSTSNTSIHTAVAGFASWYRQQEIALGGPGLGLPLTRRPL